MYVCSHKICESALVFLHAILCAVSDVEELNVLVKEGSRSATLWWLSGSHGDLWQHGEVTVGRIPQDFTILFEASRTFNRPGHIAIDDIDFTNCTLPGRLPALPEHSSFCFFLAGPLFFPSQFTFVTCLLVSLSEPQPMCPESMFMCNNSVCVEHNQVCDFSDDCGDWSEENNCGEISRNWRMVDYAPVQYIHIYCLHTILYTLGAPFVL